MGHPSPPTPDTCDAPAQPDLTVEEARQRLLEAVTPLAATETVTLAEALGRVLAEDLRASCNAPSYDNSAMDGYALRSADLPQQGSRELTVIGTALAGAPYTGKVAAGQCVRIMTGAALPGGCDTVVVQEQAQRHGDRVVIGGGPPRGQHVRRAGEDITAGETVLAAGKSLAPADLGLAASAGITRVPVARRPRVAFFSTGDELVPAGESLGEAQLYDSNRPVLHGLLRQTGVEIRDLGIVRDNAAALHQALREAAARADAVITTGGVSVGDADLVRDTLAALGEINFWRVGIKPGRPFAFGRLAGAWFFGLPGNPVSAMVTYYQFVQPALRRMMGQRPHAPPRFKVRCAVTLKKVPGRMEFQRGVLETDAAGATVVRPTGAQGSHLLHSMSEADCFIVLPAECGDLPAGTEVEVEPFGEL